MLPEKVFALASAEKISINVFEFVLFLLEMLFVELQKFNRFYQENQQCHLNILVSPL